MSLFCYALVFVYSSFAMILKRKRKLVVLLLMSYRSIITINEPWLFLTVPWVCLQCVVVVFPEYTYLRLVYAKQILQVVIVCIFNLSLGYVSEAVKSQILA